MTIHKFTDEHNNEKCLRQAIKSASIKEHLKFMENIKDLVTTYTIKFP